MNIRKSEFGKVLTNFQFNTCHYMENLFSSQGSQNLLGQVMWNVFFKEK